MVYVQGRALSLLSQIQRTLLIFADCEIMVVVITVQKEGSE